MVLLTEINSVLIDKNAKKEKMFLLGKCSSFLGSFDLILGVSYVTSITSVEIFFSENSNFSRILTLSFKSLRRSFFRENSEK